MAITAGPNEPGRGWNVARVSLVGSQQSGRRIGGASGDAAETSLPGEQFLTRAGAAPECGKIKQKKGQETKGRPKSKATKIRTLHAVSLP